MKAKVKGKRRVILEMTENQATRLKGFLDCGNNADDDIRLEDEGYGSKERQKIKDTVYKVLDTLSEVC